MSEWNLKRKALVWELEADRLLSKVKKARTGVLTTDKLESRMFS